MYDLCNEDISDLHVYFFYRRELGITQYANVISLSARLCIPNFGKTIFLFVRDVGCRIPEIKIAFRLSLVRAVLFSEAVES